MKVSDLSVNRYFIYKYHNCEFLAKTVEQLYTGIGFICIDEFSFMKRGRIMINNIGFSLFCDTESYEIIKMFDETFDPHEVYPEYYV